MLSESDYMITESFFRLPAIEADGVARLSQIDHAFVAVVAVRAQGLQAPGQEFDPIAAVRLDVVRNCGDGYATVALAHGAERFRAQLHAPEPTPTFELVPLPRIGMGRGALDAGPAAVGLEVHARAGGGHGSEIPHRRRIVKRRPRLEGRPRPQRRAPVRWSARPVAMPVAIPTETRVFRCKIAFAGGQRDRHQKQGLLGRR